MPIKTMEECIMKQTNTPEQSPGAVTIKLPAALYAKLQSLAVINGLEVHHLVSKYIEERVEEDTPMLRRKEYFDHLKTVLQEHHVPKGTMETLEDNFLY
jgi:hypothetical protein